MKTEIRETLLWLPHVLYWNKFFKLFLAGRTEGSVVDWCVASDHNVWFDDYRACCWYLWTGRLWCTMVTSWSNREDECINVINEYYRFNLSGIYFINRNTNYQFILQTKTEFTMSPFWKLHHYANLNCSKILISLYLFFFSMPGG